MPDPYVEVADSRDREAWLEARRTMVTASDVSVLFGLNPWRDPLGLYIDKLGMRPDSEQSEAMEWGLRLEDPIAKAFAEKTGRAVVPCGLLLRSTMHPVIGATLDYWQERNGDLLPLEIKTANVSKAAQWAEGVPPYYMPQVQAQMIVTGARAASVAVLIGGQSFAWCDVARDDAMCAEIVKLAEAFWRRVEQREPPDPSGTPSDSAALRALYPVEEIGKVVNLGQDAVDLTAELAVVQGRIKGAQADERRIRQQLQSLIGDAERGVLPGDLGSWTWRTVERREHTVKASSSRVLRRTK